MSSFLPTNSTTATNTDNMYDLLTPTIIWKVVWNYVTRIFYFLLINLKTNNVHHQSLNYCYCFVLTLDSVITWIYFAPSIWQYRGKKRWWWLGGFILRLLSYRGGAPPCSAQLFKGATTPVLWQADGAFVCHHTYLHHSQSVRNYFCCLKFCFINVLAQNDVPECWQCHFSLNLHCSGVYMIKNTDISASRCSMIKIKQIEGY